MRLRSVLVLLLVISLLGCSVKGAIEKISPKEAKYLANMRRIADAINEKADNKKFTAMVASMSNFDETFRRMDAYMLSRVLAKITNLDKFLYGMKGSTLKAVMKNMDPKTYKKIEPKLNWTRLRLQEMEACGYIGKLPKQADESSVRLLTVEEIFFSTIPNIPLELADGLWGLDVGTLHYIITNHFNLPALLAVMQPATLEYVLAYAPYVNDYIVLMNAETQYAILSKMPYPCEYLQSIHPEYAEIIITKLPHYRSCVPRPEITTTALPKSTVTTASTTTTATTATTTTTTMTTPTMTVEPPNVESMFKAEELEQMSQQVPKIKELLAKVNPEKVKVLRTIYPDLMEIFNGLDKEFVNVLNNFNFSSLTSQTINKLFMAMAGDNDDILLFASLFY